MENFDFFSPLDATQPLDERTEPWPGDRSFSRRWTLRMEEGDSINLGAFEMSAHLGTHTDAPLHFFEEGPGAEALPLTSYQGPARVVTTMGERVTVDDVSEHDWSETPRVLFKTFRVDPGTQWVDEFSAIDPETIAYLADAGVQLVGTDAPSLDPVDSKALPAHHAMFEHGLVNLENLKLSGIRPGRYWLSALPMRLVGMDAAPVRAVLFPERTG